MCEGTELADTPWVCVKVFGLKFTNHPKFCDAPEKYEFAVAALKGKPVFIGDTVYYKCDGEETTVMIVDNGGIIIVRDSNGEGDRFHSDKFTWTPPAPKRTFNLNGVELPCPVSKLSEHTNLLNIGQYYFNFESTNDADRVKNAIVSILVKESEK
jgi:hypothetical protein